MDKTFNRKAVPITEHYYSVMVIVRETTVSLVSLVEGDGDVKRQELAMKLYAVTLSAGNKGLAAKVKRVAIHFLVVLNIDVVWTTREVTVFYLNTVTMPMMETLNKSLR